MSPERTPCNRVIHGDCLEIMSQLTHNQFNLVYMDPPFFTQRKHSSVTRNRSSQYTFDDSWESLDSYLEFMRARIGAARDLLRSDGSIFLHCDSSANHHLRGLLDQVFGAGNFRSEVIWFYKRWSNSAARLTPSHQTLFFYSKTQDTKFFRLLSGYSETTNIEQIVQARQRDSHGVSVYARSDSGELKYSGDKMGVPLGDVWEMPYLNPKAKERVGYPTQKPIHLLERVLSLTTEEGDFVLDPFCGSGTTLVAAHMNNRRFLGIDDNEDAVMLSEMRLAQPIKSDSAVLSRGRASFRNRDARDLHPLAGAQLTIVQRNKGIDAFLAGYDSEVPVPVRVQRESERLSDAVGALAKAARGKNFKRGFVVRTHSEPASLVEGVVPDWIRIVDSAASAIDRMRQAEGTANSRWLATGGG